MENKKSIEQILDDSTNNIIYKKKQSIIFSIILIILGIIPFVLILSKNLSEDSGILTPLFFILGVGLLVWGIISIFFRKTYYVSAENNQKISFSEILFDIKERDKLIRLISEKNLQTIKELKASGHDALKLRVAMTNDGKVCYSQVVTYIPFEFVNANEVQTHSPQEAEIIKEILKERK